MSRVRLPVLGGLLPIGTSRLGPDALAGVTLAALTVPEVPGYASIAGMPVVTGLYTMMVPMVVFALLGSSRHLVVAADSATTAILAAGLVGAARIGSRRCVQLAGTAALLVGGILLAARLMRVGFLRISCPERCWWVPDRSRDLDHLHQLAEMLGVTAAADPSEPGALIAVVGAITMSHTVNLAEYRVGVLGAIPPGLPHLATPSFALPELRLLLPTAVSTFVVILAQSSATSRAYAANYGEVVSEDLDLVGLTGANLFAVFTGTFVVNGNPTKTQMLDGAGGRSELSQLTASVVVLLVVLVLTGPLAYLPIAALVTVVFLIGVELINVAGMRRIYTMRREEFGVAALTAVAMVFFGVEQGVLLAIITICATAMTAQQRGGEISSRTLVVAACRRWHTHHRWTAHLRFDTSRYFATPPG